MDTVNGKHLVLALYVNMVAVSLDDPDAVQRVAGEALGEIASAAYDSIPAAIIAQARVTATTAAASNSDYDVLIRNGHIFDGTGNPWFAADIGIRNDRIAAIGKLNSAHAKKKLTRTASSSSPASLTCSANPKSVSAHRQSIAQQALAGNHQRNHRRRRHRSRRKTKKPSAAMKPMLEQFKLRVDWTDSRWILPPPRTRWHAAKYRHLRRCSTSSRSGPRRRQRAPNAAQNSSR